MKETEQKTDRQLTDGGPCDLCGKPTFPGEQNLHTDCAKAENARDGQ